jgi:hypothetical protein
MISSDKLFRLANNLERFMTFAGIEDSAERADIERYIVKDFAENKQNSYVVASKNGVQVYRNKILTMTFRLPVAVTSGVFYFDGNRIASLNSALFFRDGTIRIEGKEATGGSSSPTSSNNNNNNNNNNG